MNEKNVKIYSYVCPYCFNVPEECSCMCLPWKLIQIDKKILPIIRELNRKCYYTEMCCEGHIGYNEFIYIEFKKQKKFKKELPKDFVYDETYIRALITGKSIEAKKRKKRQLLKNLYEWAVELEPIGTNTFMK